MAMAWALHLYPYQTYTGRDFQMTDFAYGATMMACVGILMVFVNAVLTMH